jgi:type II secretory pathway component PulM
VSGLARGDRRALWLGALIVTPVLAWRAVVAPMSASVAQQEVRAAAAAGLLARERALLRDGPQLTAALAGARRTLAAESPRLFIAADTVGATSSLAAWVRGAATAAGLHDARIEVAPAVPQPGALLGVQVDVRAQGSLTAVAGWLSALERGDRLVSVRRVEIARTDGGAIAVSARVRGMARQGAR